MSAQTYILTGKHRTADGTLLSAGDEIQLTPEKAQALVGKVVLASAAEAAEAMANSSSDERVAELTAQVESLSEENAELKARLSGGEEGEQKPGLLRRAADVVTGNNSANASSNADGSESDETVRVIDSSKDSSDL